MARARKPTPTPHPDPFPWAAIKADTLRAICAQLLDYASTSPSTPKNGYETRSGSTSAWTTGSPSKTSIADALKQSRQKLRSRKDIVSFLEGVNEFGCKLFYIEHSIPWIPATFFYWRDTWCNMTTGVMDSSSVKRGSLDADILFFFPFDDDCETEN